jgi:hypothetical protein
VWYDPEGTQPVTSNEVFLLQRLYTNGIALLFAGPNISSAAAGLPSDSQAAWQSLVHLNPATGSSSNNFVVPLPNAQGDPMLNGAYGSVGTFMLQSALDQTTVTADADSMAQFNGGDVVVRFPSANDPNQNQVRTVTQLFSLDSPGDTNSFPMRMSLFQNTICWLLQCGACPAVFPTFGYTVDPLVPQTGTPITLTLSLGNSGECDGVGYFTTVRLAQGLKYVSATSDFGRVTYTNQVVSLYGGRLPARQSINFSITVIAQIPGSLTNQVFIQSASSPSQSHDAVIDIQGNALNPQWQIQVTSTNTVRLSLSNAVSGQSYAIQRAIIHPGLPNFLWTTITNFTFIPPEFDLIDQIQSTNSGALYKAIPQ